MRFLFGLLAYTSSQGILFLTAGICNTTVFTPPLLWTYCQFISLDVPFKKLIKSFLVRLLSCDGIDIACMDIACIAEKEYEHVSIYIYIYIY